MTTLFDKGKGYDYKEKLAGLNLGYNWLSSNHVVPMSTVLMTLKELDMAFCRSAEFVEQVTLNPRTLDALIKDIFLGNRHMVSPIVVGQVSESVRFGISGRHRVAALCAGAGALVKNAQEQTIPVLICHFTSMEALLEAIVLHNRSRSMGLSEINCLRAQALGLNPNSIVESLVAALDECPRGKRVDVLATAFSEEVGELKCQFNTGTMTGSLSLSADTKFKIGKALFNGIMHFKVPRPSVKKLSDEAIAEIFDAEEDIETYYSTRRAELNSEYPIPETIKVCKLESTDLADLLPEVVEYAQKVFSSYVCPSSHVAREVVKSEVLYGFVTKFLASTTTWDDEGDEKQGTMNEYLSELHEIRLAERKPKATSQRNTLLSQLGKAIKAEDSQLAKALIEELQNKF